MHREFLCAPSVNICAQIGAKLGSIKKALKLFEKNGSKTNARGCVTPLWL